MEFSNSEKVIINTSQKIYDAFNDFIFSNDIKVLSKLIARALLLEQTKHIPGDIVECGVFKGSGILSWLKLKKILSPNSIKKIIGFDIFDTNSLLESLSGTDKIRMNELFIERGFEHKSDYKDILDTIIKAAGFNDSNFELVKGDISVSADFFCKTRPGFKISILYLDMDIEKPTFDALNSFWNKVSIGGLVVFDEYAYHQWSEAIAVDKFFGKKNVEIKTLDYACPTAYVRKTTYD
jgi:hypothetical protein